MAEIAGLLEILLDDRRIRSDDLRSSSARLGLERLVAILLAGLATDEGRAGFEAWNGDQVDAVIYASRAVVSAVLANPGEPLEPLVLATIEKSLDFSVQYLEKSSFAGDDFSLQNRVVQFMHLSLETGVLDSQDVHEIRPTSVIVEGLSSIPIKSTSIELGTICFVQGFDCPKENVTVSPNLLTTLSSEFSQPNPISKLQSCLAPSLVLMTSAARHFALVHIKYIPRLLKFCHSLLEPPSSSDKLEDSNLLQKLSFGLKTLKLLKTLVTESPGNGCDTELLRSVASYVDSVPPFFKLSLDLGTVDGASFGDALGSILLQTIDELMQFVNIAFYTGDVCRAVEACLIASVFEILSSKSWRYEKMSPSLRAPLVCSPRVVQYLFKLVTDSKRWISRSELDTNGLNSDTSNPPSCRVRYELVFLLEKFSHEDLINLVFPTTENWMDDLINLVSYLHTLALKSAVLADKSRATCTKPVVVSDTESVMSHDDEALFGDLFAEASRSSTLSDVLDQPVLRATGSNGANSAPCGPIQALTDLFTFLKTCTFSPDWYRTVYEDACAKVNFNHINLLLSILDCHNVLCIERNLDSSQSSINELCFDLLRTLVASHECPFSLKQYLVDQILGVEHGVFLYNHYSLALVAHILVSGNDLGGGDKLRSGLFKRYMDYIVYKVNDSMAITSLTEATRLWELLPCAFHSEILIMAFHLSSPVEKQALADLVFSTLKKLAATPPPATGLSVWALFVSRIVLLLKHMVLYPLSCPPWFLSRFRSKLREVPYRPEDFLFYLHDCFASLAFPISGGIFGNTVKGTSVASNLLPQLFDAVPLHASFYTDGSEDALQNLGLDLHELIETVSTILGFWKGKRGKSPDDLIVERYLFVTFWSTLSAVKPGMKNARIGVIDWKNLDFSDNTAFLSFSLGLIGEGVTSGDILGALNCLHSEISQELDGTENWEFLRKNSWLSLLVSLLHTNSSRFVTENKMDSEFIDILSSILEIYLGLVQSTFLSSFDQSRSSLDNSFSILLLVKHTAFDKSKQDLIHNKVGFDLTRLETIYNLLPKLEGIGSKFEVITNCLFHGFPEFPNSCSGTLLSCVLSIKEVVCAIDVFLKVMREKNGIELDASITRRVLGLVMAIKTDKIFSSVHPQCDTVCSTLIGEQKDLEGYKGLFTLKQLEQFLVQLNSEEGIDCEVREMVISSLVTSIDELRKDGSKADFLKFYIGSDEGVSREAVPLFGTYRADLLVLIDALDKSQSETVNLQVIGLFVDILASGLCPSLKEKLRKKFLAMDTGSLSNWLEARLLGGTGTGTGSVRESTVDFLMRLTSPLNETWAIELQTRLGESVLVLLDTAFLQRDLQSAEPYFNYAVKLLSCEPTGMKSLLENTLKLMKKMVEKESLLPGLKFLLTFFDAVFGENSIPTKPSLKSLSSKISNSSAVSSVSLLSNKSFRSLCKNPESEVVATDAVLAKQIVGTSSGEEDDDDGTTDGDFDREEEEDSNSERALVSKVCTFTSSGSNFMEQHWYFCYTCDLTISKGCCSVCARVCHKGHRVVYSRSSRFFCDCGAGGARGTSCQCLKPRKFTGQIRSSAVPVPGTNTGIPSSIPYAIEEVDEDVDSGSDLDDDVADDGVDRLYKLSLPKEFHDELPEILDRLGVENQIVRICDKLLPGVMCKRESNLLKAKRVILGSEKKVSYVNDLFLLKKAFKSGSMDLKIKSDYPNSRDLKSHLSSGSLTKSLLSVSVRGKLAVGEGDKIAIFDIGQLIGQPSNVPVMADKTNVKPLSRNMIRFEIVHLSFNPLVENYVCVAGYEECQVLTVNSRGEVTDRLAIELALQGGAYLRKIEWVPGSQVQLMVASNMFVKIYDLSQDNISPVHYFTLENDSIVDATLVPASMGKLFLLVLSESGILYWFEVSMEGDVGAKTLTDAIHIEGKQTQSRGVSLYFSSTYRLLFIAYQDGTSLLGRLDSHSKTLAEISFINEEEKEEIGTVKPAALHHWRELIVGTGVFCCQSGLKSNAALCVSLGTHELSAQNMKHGGGNAASAMVGVAAYTPLSKDKTNCLIMFEDGSLHIFAYTGTSGEDVGSSGTTSEQKRKLGPSILISKDYTGTNPEFPVDFFEKTMCISSDVKLICDTFKGGDSETIKQRLTSDDGYLEGPNSSGFKVTVTNPNQDIVMVGCRIHVGTTSSSHVPSELTVFQRTIKLDEGFRSWYDIPFTTAESLLADEEFTLTIGPTFDKVSTPRIDFFEIYGRSKDEFGWKEKMDEVLNLEASVLTGHGGAGGSAAKRLLTSAASSIQEQVLADALKILARVYVLCGSRQEEYSETGDAEMEIEKLRCKDLLETVFQSDHEPLLQLAACRVLQAVFPKRETYYHVKDTMRLLGVIKSFPIISSRIGGGGATSAWVLKEFIAQIQAVSKITLSRRANMASFLLTHGSEVVDGLMEIFWGILNLERPDTHTINTIVVPCVDLIYSYAECLASIAEEDATTLAVAPAVSLLKQLLFAPYEAVQTSSSLAISSRLLQVPFPKQTMIAAIEDAAHPVPSDTSGQTGNTTIMVDEDPATTSVQYCCDGCSSVPIARRRWHCTVCPDFDLCDTCYQVLGAEQLPHPHARDHPMKAILIELDSVSPGDGTAPSSDVHFSLDDPTDPSPVPSSAVPVERSSSSIHVLETADNAELASQRIVSISAAKRAVNSLLLRGLIEELNGWMEGISGTRALPVMQFFYRLSSALGGPFMDGSKERPSETLDLERFVKWLLDEIDITKPFPAKARSSFGEVAILVFMFFTLMFRNWHQPGGSGSDGLGSGSKTDPLEKGTVQVSTSSAPAGDDLEKDEFDSQLANACSYLRNQGFLDYLMEVLQQLEHVFKSAPGTEMGAGTGPGCGSLLTVRRELPAGNFSPFFSDSYAKSHSKDLFADYHKLLLENTFRLVYSMVRPEKHDKSGEKDVKTQKPIVPVSGTRDLKLDGHQDILCSYISNPNTNFVRRYARRLFLHVCGSKTHYYSVRDAWQYSHEVKRLHKIVNKSGGFKNPVPYERSVKLIKCLSTLCEVAQSRPKNWQKYCLKNSDLLPFLTNSLFYFGEESVIQGLKLLNLALYTGKESIQKPDSGVGTVEILFPSKSSESKKKRKGVEEAGESSSSEKSCMDMELALEMFSEKDGVLLGRFVETFLLQWSSASVRNEAKCVLYGMWYHAKAQFKESMLNALLEKVRCLPMYGQNIVEYTDLMAWLLAKGAINIIGTGTGTGSGKSLEKEKDIISRCLTSYAVTSIYETLHAQNELLANHPNSRIYNTLSSLVEFDGYYLESEPCVSCSCPDVPYSRIKLETLKSETKYTDNRIIVKCTGCFMIQSITMNIHDARKSKSVKVLNLYYNNRPVADLSELKNNWSLWKRAKSCHLAANQTELKVEFPIPITACNLMIELDSFYENLQAFSLESLQCPRCSRSVTDKHGICGNCHENAYQCRQCRNINYENLDSFLCNECGYSKFGRFEFHFMAKPSFSFDNMENDEDMKKGLAAIETESENAHRRYQQLLGFKKPLVKLVSSIGEHEMDSQQKDTVQQMMISLPGPSCKVNRKIALLGVLYGEKCKAAFDSVSKSVQTLQGLRRVLMAYLHQKGSDEVGSISQPILTNPRSSNNCYGCATTFVTQCLELLQVLAKHPACKKQLISAGILSELFENNIHLGPRTTRVLARSVISSFSEGDSEAVSELNGLIKKKITYCLEHHRSMDIASATREELSLLSETCALVDDLWESRLRIAFQILFSSIKVGAKHPAISENIILPCLKIVSQACTPPRSDPSDANKDQDKGKIGSPVLNPKSEISTVTEKTGTGKVAQEIPLLSYSEWERGATYLDFVRRQYKVSSTVKTGTGPTVQRSDYLALKYGLRWKRRTFKRSSKSDFSKFALGSWISELILSACSQSIRSEVCTLINLLFPTGSSRQYQLLNLLMNLLPATLNAGESAGEYFELFFNMVESEETRLFLTVKGCLGTICKLITNEVSNVESQERSLAVDISQGFILHKLIELLNKFLEVPNIRTRFMRDELLSEVLEAFLIIRGLVVQKTKLITDCTRLLKELLDSLVLESTDNKRQFIRACVAGLQKYAKEQKRRTSLFILEQLCNMICPSKPEPVYLLILNKAHTQEEFIRGSMTKNPYLSTEIGPLMRDVKNKICHQLDLMGLVEDDYGMELLVAGNIISLDLSIPQVFELVWKKHSSGSHAAMSAITGMSPSSQRDTPPMTVTYRLQGLDGEATEPMIKELEEEREESQDPEVEFAIAGAVRECGGLEIILSMIQRLRDEDLRSNQEELGSVLNLLKYCCKIHENRCALLQLGALGLLLETARRAFSVDSMESAEGILLIVESLTIEANKSDISITQGVRTEETTGAGEQSKKIVVMFLERLCHPVGTKRSNKQQRNDEMVTRILPYLTYGEPAAMDALIQHFEPYLTDWARFDQVQKEHVENLKDENLGQLALGQRSALENFVRVSESLNSSSCGEGLKDIILEKGITKAAVTHLRESFGVPESKPESFKNLAEWAVALKLPSVPLILSMLRGLSKGHLGTQNCIDEQGVLPLFHALESVVGENEIGVKAENLLDTLANKENNGDGFLGEKIDVLRHTTKDEMRRRALKKRETLLKGLGMRQELGSDGGKRIVVSQPSIEGLDDVEEETNGLACMVCREGYTLRPNDILGVYSFSKRVNLGASGTTGTTSRGDCVYTTVSHFNIIHFQCHQEAKRADAALKNPKREWDGATLRNNETLCNCIFPLRGPAVPLVQYARCVDQYWENLSALGRADGSRLRLLTYDIVLMLARFATGALFNVDARGGGRESNSRFLPFMVQMGSYMLDQGNPSFTNQRRSMAKLISSYLSSSSSSSSLSPPGSRLSPSVTPAEETVQYMMVNSLLSNSYEEWVHHRPSFIQRGIYHAYMQRKQSSSTDLTDNTKLLGVVQPMLVYTGLIEQMQKFFKVNKKSQVADEPGLERWEVVMRERMGNMSEMVGFSKDMLDWLEDMTTASDLQEAFDVMGALEDVFLRGFTQCEEFVRSAITAGKN